MKDRRIQVMSGLLAVLVVVVPQVNAGPVPTPEQIAATNAVVNPRILDGLMATFLADPRSSPC